MDTQTDFAKQRNLVAPSEPEHASDLFAGVWVATDQAGEQMEIEIYNHPERGLCVWFDDYAPGNSTLFSGNGHVPVHASGLTFVRPSSCSLRDAYNIVLGGVMAISPELYSQALRKMAQLMGRVNDDAFQKEVVAISRAMPCDID